MAFVPIRLTDDYATSPWSALCRAARQNANNIQLVNYATFWYGTGIMFNAATRPSNNYHSEKEVWMAINGIVPLSAILVPNWLAGQHANAHQTADQLFAAQGFGIAVVYTERQPCGSCSPFLNDVLPNGTPVFWHFSYPSKDTKKFQQDPETVAALGLMAISKSQTYGESMKDIRSYREEGNSSLRQDLRDYSNNWSRGPGKSSMQLPGTPMSAYAQRFMKV